MLGRISASGSSFADLPSDHVDPGTRASPGKRALLDACSSVTDLTAHIGTELLGVQIANLTPQQLDDLGLLIAERSVVFLRDQKLAPQDQRRIGEHFGEVEVHPQVPQVPGVPGVTVMWPDLQGRERIQAGNTPGFRNPGGASGWHTDLVHERQPAGVTHLHNDTVPTTGGDTLWSSGYSAYEKLSPDFRKFLDGKTAIYRSAHQYHVRGKEHEGPKFLEREHPLVRVHPATGWKSLWVNRAMTVRIVGLDKRESDVILNYLYDVYERNVDIQVRFKWSAGASGKLPSSVGRYVCADWVDSTVGQSHHSAHCVMGL